MKYLLIAFLLLSLAACDRSECKNTNPVFEKYAPASNEYKAELTRQINSIGMGKLDYTIGLYSKEGDKDYMNIFIQGHGLCAKGMLDITGAERWQNYKMVQGNGYNGAGLRGLRYRIDSANGNYNFVFEDVSWIMD